MSVVWKRFSAKWSNGERAYLGRVAVASVVANVLAPKGAPPTWRVTVHLPAISTSDKNGDAEYYTSPEAAKAHIAGRVERFLEAAGLIERQP